MSLLLLLGGCITAEPSHDTVARSTSPDGTIDALVIESNDGATTSFWYDVCLVPRGRNCSASESLARLYGATRSDQAYGANVRWANASLIYVEYLEAQRASVLHSAINISAIARLMSRCAPASVIRLHRLAGCFTTSKVDRKLPLSVRLLCATS